MSNSSIWPTDDNLSGASILSQIGYGGNSNEGVLHISQSCKSRDGSDGLVSHPGHVLGCASNPSAEIQLVYFTVPAYWAIDIFLLHLNVNSCGDAYIFLWNLKIFIRNQNVQRRIKNKNSAHESRRKICIKSNKEINDDTKNTIKRFFFKSIKSSGSFDGFGHDIKVNKLEEY